MSKQFSVGVWGLGFRGLGVAWRPIQLSNIGFRVPFRGSFTGTMRVSGFRATGLRGQGT